MTATLLLLRILSLVVIISKAADSHMCNKSTSNTEMLLKQHLLCNGYDPKIRPAKNEFDMINITSTAFLADFDVAEYRRVLHIEMLYHMSWDDRSLKWNSSDWSNITLLHLGIDEIWVPQFEQINSDYAGVSSLSCDNPRCLLNMIGRIVCVPLCKLTVKCSPDYSRWPYSTMDCRMWFSNLDKELVDEINFLPFRTFMPIFETRVSAKWCITAFTSNNTTLDVPGASGRTVQELRFNLQHTPHTILATIYFPAFALMMLNMFISWLQSLADERTKIILLSFMCHFAILHDISIRSSVVPDMVLFIIASMVLTILLFVITLMLRWIYDLHATPPRMIIRWMRRFTNMRLMDWFLRTEYLSLGHKQTSVTDYVELRDWPTIVKLADRSIFVLYAFIYLLLFWIYIPLQHDKYNKTLHEPFCSH